MTVRRRLEHLNRLVVWLGFAFLACCSGAAPSDVAESITPAAPLGRTAVRPASRITLLTHCTDPTNVDDESVEIQSDLHFHFNRVAPLFKAAGIETGHAGDAGCGYRFTNGDNTKLLRGVMTDVDLLLAAQEFFPHAAWPTRSRPQ